MTIYTVPSCWSGFDFFGTELRSPNRLWHVNFLCQRARNCLPLRWCPVRWCPVSSTPESCCCCRVLFALQNKLIVCFSHKLLSVSSCRLAHSSRSSLYLQLEVLRLSCPSRLSNFQFAVCCVNCGRSVCNGQTPPFSPNVRHSNFTWPSLSSFATHHFWRWGFRFRSCHNSNVIYQIKHPDTHTQTRRTSLSVIISF